MTSIVQKSYSLVRIYSGLRRTLILQNVKKLQPIRTRNISKTSRHLSRAKEDDDIKEDTESKEVGFHFHGFMDVKKKEKQTYLQVLRIFVNRDINRRGHVEFIYAAMRHMKEFGVNKDLEAYKNLLNVLPKGKFIPKNNIQAEFMHYPKQQQCAIDLLEQMEDNGVMPDKEMGEILLNTFGGLAFPLRKFWRMMYWMPKFKNASPWPLPDVLPNDSLQLAKLAIERITSVDVRSRISVFQAKDLQDSIDDTWIVSGMSPDQEILLARHSQTVPIYVEGPFRIWLKDVPLNYFILRADAVQRPPPIPVDVDDVSKIQYPYWSTSPAVREGERTVHDQEDGTILSVCATGTSSRDSLLSWIRFLEKKNPVMANIPVLFTLKSPIGAVALTTDDESRGFKDTEEGEKRIGND